MGNLVELDPKLPDGNLHDNVWNVDLKQSEKSLFFRDLFLTEA